MYTIDVVMKNGTMVRARFNHTAKRIKEIVKSSSKIFFPSNMLKKSYSGNEIKKVVAYSDNLKRMMVIKNILISKKFIKEV